QGGMERCSRTLRCRGLADGRIRQPGRTGDNDLTSDAQVDCRETLQQNSQSLEGSLRLSTDRQKPQPKGWGFACDCAAKGQTKTAHPARQFCSIHFSSGQAPGSWTMAQLCQLYFVASRTPSTVIIATSTTTTSNSMDPSPPSGEKPK